MGTLYDGLTVIGTSESPGLIVLYNEPTVLALVTSYAGLLSMVTFSFSSVVL